MFKDIIAIAAVGLFFLIWHAVARGSQPTATDAVPERETIAA